MSEEEWDPKSLIVGCLARTLWGELADSPARSDVLIAAADELMECLESAGLLAGTTERLLLAILWEAGGSVTISRSAAQWVDSLGGPAGYTTTGTEDELTVRLVRLHGN